MVCAETTSPPGGFVVVALAMPRARSRKGFCLPFELAQDAQFFQNPIVRARPPGGGVLSTLNVRVWPEATVKLTQTVRLLTVGFGSDGGMMLFGTNSGPSPDRFVFQPGNTHSQSW